MADNSSNVAIIALFLIAILVGSAALAIIFSDDFTLPGQGNVGPTPTPTPVPERADLRIIAMPYIAATDIENTCELLGGEWTYDEDFVGCTGVNVSDCSTAAAVSGMLQCEEVGGTWYCGENGLWCKYN